MRAAWWWIDRWRKSTAYTDMSAEAQGIYRNLLDELWIRDGVIPPDERILRKIGGDYEAWDRVGPEVMSRFYLTDAGWRNETHDEVMERSRYQAEKQKRYRERQKNVTGNVTGSPSPSPSKATDNGISIPSESHPDEKPSGRVRNEYPEHFLTFWNAYPSKIGKKVALRSWRTHVAPHAREWVIEQVERHKRESPKWKEGIIPNPATWLNQGRWDDEFKSSVPVQQSGQPQNGREAQLREMAKNPQRRDYALKALRAEGFDE
jgi:uncharacterized protein YdaU (DUF1376 family)